MECHELATMIFPQQVTEGQLIKKEQSLGRKGLVARTWK
jgi:hypothetical protein